MAKAKTEDPIVEPTLLGGVEPSESADKPKGRFAALRDEALKDYTPAEPYPFDADPDNIVWVTKPEDAERSLTLATIIDRSGNIDMDQVKPMLQTLLGDAFEAVWEVVGPLPIEVTIELILDMQDFFYGQNADEVKSLPGGSRGSSS